MLSSSSSSRQGRCDSLLIVFVCYLFGARLGIALWNNVLSLRPERQAAGPLQIDCVTVKGSTQPMGLFTYDITLERVSPPAATRDGAATEDVAAPDSTLDVETFSHGSYDNEFEEHPDLTQ